jgi:hypothetical protein
MSAIAPPPLELTVAYDEAKVSKRSHKKTDDGVVTKVEIPIYDHGTKEEFLRMIYQFKRAATIMEWTTGAQLYSQFSLHLSGVTLTTWEMLILGANQTPATFRTRLNTFKQRKFGPSAIPSMKRYLRTVRKPRSLTVEAFVNRIQFLNLLLTEFPDATATDALDEDEIKDIIYNAMPTTWQ